MVLLPDTYRGKAGIFIRNKHQGEADTFISKAGGFYPVKTLCSFFLFFFSLPACRPNENGLDSDVFFV